MGSARSIFSFLSFRPPFLETFLAILGSRLGLLALLALLIPSGWKWAELDALRLRQAEPVDLVFLVRLQVECDR